MKYNNSKGFSLIELLLVIAIIGLLAMIFLISAGDGRARARDARRKSELNQIAAALEFYYNDFGTYAIANSGSEGRGLGWFSHAYTGYPSVAQALKNTGLVGPEFVDPSGARAGSPRAGYMIIADATGYTLWASLEKPTQEDKNTLNTCRSSTYDAYHSSDAEDLRTNYCISN